MCTMAGTLEASSESLAFLSEKVLPQALGDLESRHESARELVQYLEDKYLLSKQRGESLQAVQEEGMSVLVDTLQVVANDIDVVAINLQRMLELEGEAITTLSQRMQVAVSRMRLSEEQYARAKLRKVRTNKNTRMDVSEACKQLVSVPSAHPQAFERYSIKKRLNKRSGDVYTALR